ncbi:MAG: gamma-glutamylcyclotransferase family protein [Methylococcaceae bacterium]|jgi:gamma-glutamylcyclotransferase (GGCT)/AIG2-like uncharacterized protein YtfP
MIQSLGYSDDSGPIPAHSLPLHDPARPSSTSDFNGKPMHSTASVFTYGTLQLPSVMSAVIGRCPVAGQASLNGYARYRLLNYSYPGLRREAGAVTSGVLYSGLDPAELARLDAFEDTFYRRESLAVTTAAGLTVAAWVYVVPPQYYSLLDDQPWCLTHFQSHALAGFLEGRIGD